MDKDVLYWSQPELMWATSAYLQTMLAYNDNTVQKPMLVLLVHYLIVYEIIFLAKNAITNGNIQCSTWNHFGSVKNFKGYHMWSKRQNPFWFYKDFIFWKSVAQIKDQQH